MTDQKRIKLLELENEMLRFTLETILKVTDYQSAEMAAKNTLDMLEIVKKDVK